MKEDEYYDRQRLHMVAEQIEAREVDDPRVLEAMRQVPRHAFIPREYRHLAYADCPLPIGNEQTISQPYIVALMSQMLMLDGDETVLEVGTGSGYQAAILSRLARQVYTIERHGRLGKRAARLLAQMGFENVEVCVGDGSLGWPEHAPYQAILATAAAPTVPPPLLEQLADRGRIVLPVGRRGGQYLERWIRDGQKYHREQGAPVAFVPLVGEQGWRENAWDWF